MNILIVDDQKAVVNSLCNGIDWTLLGFEQIYTACSAREARLILSEFDIGILLTDIEMPEEDGLELFQWTHLHYPDIIGIFLTSHADFEYARRAIAMGGFDYILQPARYEDIIETVKKAVGRLEDVRKIHTLKKRSQLMFEQMDANVERLMLHVEEHRASEGEGAFSQIHQFYVMDYGQCVYWPLWISILYFKNVSYKWDEKLLRMLFGNVLEEIFASQRCNVCIGSTSTQEFLVLVLMDNTAADYNVWKKGIEEFVQFINRHMDFAVAAYPVRDGMKGYDFASLESLEKRRRLNSPQKQGIFWESEKEPDAEHNEERIRQAVQYIRDHISHDISRKQVAEMLHLNEEYFSRLFKKYTGYTFKDYEVMERINQAKKLLKHSKFSISMIAARVGYDNFSYFSKAFKKITGQTPQEFRKNCER